MSIARILAIVASSCFSGLDKPKVAAATTIGDDGGAAARHHHHRLRRGLGLHPTPTWASAERLYHYLRRPRCGRRRGGGATLPPPLPPGIPPPSLPKWAAAARLYHHRLRRPTRASASITAVATASACGVCCDGGRRRRGQRDSATTTSAGARAAVPPSPPPAAGMATAQWGSRYMLCRRLNSLAIQDQCAAAFQSAGRIAGFQMCRHKPGIYLVYTKKTRKVYTRYIPGICKFT